MRRRPPGSIPPPLESHEMRAAARWLDLVGVLWCHVPNGGKRHVGIARKLKAEGVKSGVPDLLIFTPCPHRPEARGVAIELKRVRGVRVSDEQKQWMSDLTAAGWLCFVCLGASGVVATMMSLGYGIGCVADRTIAVKRLDGIGDLPPVGANRIVLDE